MIINPSRGVEAPRSRRGLSPDVRAQRPATRSFSGLPQLRRLAVLTGFLALVSESFQAQAEYLRPRAVLRGHTDAVEGGVAFSPDGKLLVSAGGSHGDDTMRLWEIPSGRQRDIFTKRNTRIRNLAFSPDGKTVATSSSYRPNKRGNQRYIPDETVELWDITTGNRRVILKTADIVFCLEYSPDGKTLLISVAGLEGRILLWNVASQRFRAALGNGSLPFCLPFSDDVAFSRDGTTLATTNEGSIVLWDTKTWEQRAVLKRHKGPVDTLTFSPDGRFLAAPGAAGNVQVWSLVTNEVWRTLPGNKETVTSMAYSPDGKLLATGDADGMLRFIETTTYGRPLVVKGHEKLIRSLAFSPDSKLLATASKDHTIKLWDVADALRELPKPLTGER